jgi:hypothetical protein
MSGGAFLRPPERTNNLLCAAQPPTGLAPCWQKKAGDRAHGVSITGLTLIGIDIWGKSATSRK